jgi:hypothetical protein
MFSNIVVQGISGTNKRGSLEFTETFNVKNENLRGFF